MISVPRKLAAVNTPLGISFSPIEGMAQCFDCKTAVYMVRYSERLPLMPIEMEKNGKGQHYMHTCEGTRKHNETTKAILKAAQ